MTLNATLVKPESSSAPVNLRPARPDAALLASVFEGLPTRSVMHKVILEIFPGRIALVSSFGTEAAILLDLVARVDPGTPVIFLETGKHFPETLAYRDMLVARLGLTNVRDIHPEPAEVAAEDPEGDLWRTAPDNCCDLRKVRPLARELSRYDAWFTGRKRYHGAGRQSLPLVEEDGPHIKINPLGGWSPQDIEDYYTNFGLPRHPLFDRGYTSVGCAVCTARPSEGGDVRSGRWQGKGKTECGIHRMKWDVGL